MNQKRVVNTLFILVIVLIIINAVSLGALFFTRGHPQGRGEGRGLGRPGQYLIEELDFTPDQQSQFELLRNEHHGQVVQIQEQCKNQKILFYGELKNGQIDSAKVDSLSKVVSEMHRKMDLITFGHFKKVRAICDSRQQARFDELIREGLFLPQSGNGPQR